MKSLPCRVCGEVFFDRDLLIKVSLDYSPCRLAYML